MIFNLSPLSFYDDVMEKGREHFTAHNVEVLFTNDCCRLEGIKRRELNEHYLQIKLAFSLLVLFCAIDHFYGSQMGSYCLEYSS